VASLGRLEPSTFTNYHREAEQIILQIEEQPLKLSNVSAWVVLLAAMAACNLQAAGPLWQIGTADDKCDEFVDYRAAAGPSRS
jgi:hypothetical protein